MSIRRRNKAKSTKHTEAPTVWAGKESHRWTVHFGELRRARGRPTKAQSLFKVVAEKLPFESIGAVQKRLDNEELSRAGVYVAHDSMGFARYIGRGQNVFMRLKARHKVHPNELKYFSFFVVEEKKHENEIETILIRAAGPHLHFNTKKRQLDIEPGDVRDFEAGTHYFERLKRRGRKRRRGGGTKSSSPR
jgi:hypothetical protein